MAYIKKRIVRRRKTYKRKPTLAKKVAKIQKIVRAQRPETKFLHDDVSQEVLWDGQVIYPFLQFINSGTGQGARVGNKINPTRLTLRGHVRYNQAYASVGQTQMIRLILFRGSKEYGTTYQVQSSQDIPSGILTDNSNNNSAALLSPYHWNNRRRFTVLYDKTFTFTVGGVQTRMLNWSFKLKGNTTYIDTSGPEVVNNGLYLAAISSAQNDGPILIYDWRVTYTDA